MSERIHRGVRCGIDVYNPNSGCRDCQETEPELMRAWKKVS